MTNQLVIISSQASRPTPIADVKRVVCAMSALVAMMVIAFALPASAQAANRYWVGSAGGNTNDTANWSTAANSCGTSGGASVPTSADVAYFVSNCTNNATINSAFTALGVNIASGYTGTITQASTVTITIGTTGWTQAGGTFVGGDSLSDVHYLTLSGGTYSNSTGGVWIRTNLSWSGGTLSNTGNTITLATAYPSSGTLTCTGTIDGTVVIYGGGTTGSRAVTTISSGCNINLGAAPTSYVGSLVNNGTINITSGSWRIDGYYPTLTNNGIINHNGDGWSIKSSLINNEAGVINFAGTMTISNHLTQNGTFDMSGVTVTFASETGTATTLTCNGDLGGTVIISKGSNEIFTLSSGCGINLGADPVTTASPLNNYGTINIPSGTWSFNATYREIKNYGTINHLGTGWNINGTLTNDINGVINYSGSVINISNSLSYYGDFDLTGITITINGNNNGSSVIGCSTTIPTVVTISKGSRADINLSENCTIQLGDNPTTTFNNFTNNGTIIVNSGVWTLPSTADVLNNNSVIDFRGSSIANSVRISNNAGSDFIYAPSTTNMEIYGINYHNLIMDKSGSTFTAPATLNVAGDLTLTNGTFAHNNGTVNLNGTNQTISGAFTFYNLTKSVSAASTLTFPAGETTTVANNLSLQGATGNLLSLRSSSTGVGVSLPVTGTVTASYLDIKDNSLTKTVGYCTTGCVDSGDNWNWIFGYMYLAGKIGSGGTADTLLTGTLDETRIFSRTLNASEMSKLASSTAPGPIAHWKMDDNVQGDSKTIADNSGSGLHGTTVDGANNTGMDCTVQGKYGKACRFDGTDDKVAIANSDELQPQQLTISAWIKSVGNTWNHHIISKCSSDGSCTTGYVLQLMSGNYYSFARGLTGGAVGLGAPSGDWEHIAIVYDGTKAIGYKNGVVINTSNYTGTITHSNQDLILGGWTAGIQYWGGYLDDVKIYNYARTQKQIVEDMNAGNPAGGVAGLPLAHWKFDEGEGDVGKNQGSGGSTYNANLTGSCPGEGTCPTWIDSDISGKALSFDGSNDQVDVPGFTWTPTAYSVSFWLYPLTRTNWNQTLGATNNWGAFAFHTTSDGSVYVGSDVSTRFTPTQLPANTVLLNAWQHFVFTFDNGKAAFYKNGQLLASKTGMAASGAWGGFKMGLNTTNSINGYLDEVKIYDYALNSNQVIADYENSQPYILGSVSTKSDGVTPSWGQTSSYCVPGDTTSCSAPVAEWKMDEGVTGNAQTINDHSGNARTGTTSVGANGTGMDCTVAGKLGKACQFDGIDDYISAAGSSPTTNTFSFGGWVKANATHEIDAESNSSTGGTSGQKYVIFPQNSGTSGGAGLSVGTNGISVYEHGSGYLPSIAVYEANIGSDWNHIYVVYQDKQPKIYLNGKLVHTGLTSVKTSVYAPFTGIGGGAYGYFSGSLDHIQIYNYARTPAQIAWDYNRGAPVAHYKFDECTGSTVNDWAPNSNGGFNGNNGTINAGSSGNLTAGTCSSGSSTEMWNNGTTGKFNASLDFDGSDDAVTVPFNSLFDLTDNLSVSFWFKPATTIDQKIASNMGIISKASSNADADNDWTFFWNSTNVGRMRFGSYGDFVQTTNSTWTAGTWYHVVATVTGNSTVNVYVNGKLNNYEGDYSISTNPINGGTDTPLQIGYSRVTTGDHYFDGQIDEFKIFNYPLTAEQVKLEYNQNAAVRFGD